MFGSKDSLQPTIPYYDGSGMIGLSNNNMIFVTMELPSWGIRIPRGDDHGT